MTSENKLVYMMICRNMRNRVDELVEHLNGHTKQSQWRDLI